MAWCVTENNNILTFAFIVSLFLEIRLFRFRRHVKIGVIEKI